MSLSQKQSFVAFFIALSALLYSSSVSAWTGPTAAPPGNNVPAPINVGTTNQVKSASLGVNGLAVFGNSLLGGTAGSNAYLNFGGITGSSGYGIWDNNGTLNFKDSGGSWASIQSTVTSLINTSSQWTTSGNDIYNNNTNNVGIGIASPGYKLDVNGTIYARSNVQAVGNLYTGNGASWFATNGDSYMSYSGRYLSAALGWNGSGYAPSFVGLNVSGGLATVYSELRVPGGFRYSGAGSVAGSYGPGNYYVCLTNGGFVSVYSSCGGSDARLKTNVADLPDAQGLAAINALRPVTFNWKDIRQKAQGQQIGLIAQEVRPFFPQLVKENGTTTVVNVGGSTTTVTDTLSVNYPDLVVPLIKAVQELDRKIEDQQKQIDALKAEIHASAH